MKSEMPPIFLAFLDCFALAVACCGLSCGRCFAPVVCGFLLGCGLCCWCFFFPLDDCDKKKGQAVGACPLFVGCGLGYPIALGITKLLQAVSILRAFPTIQATEKKLLL